MEKIAQIRQISKIKKNSNRQIFMRSFSRWPRILKDSVFFSYFNILYVAKFTWGIWREKTQLAITHKIV